LRAKFASSKLYTVPTAKPFFSTLLDHLVDRQIVAENW